MHAAWGDYDNDGYPDLYLINYGKNLLLQNQQNSTFKDVTEQTGTGNTSWGMGGGFVDFDHDGDLDILVANFVNIDPESFPGGDFPGDYSGAPNVLYQNNGDGTFTKLSTGPLGTSEEGTMEAEWIDVNNDGRLDLFVVNYLDFTFGKAGDQEFGMIRVESGEVRGFGGFDLVIRFPLAQGRRKCEYQTGQYQQQPGGYSFNSVVNHSASNDCK